MRTSIRMLIALGLLTSVVIKSRGAAAEDRLAPSAPAASAPAASAPAKAPPAKHARRARQRDPLAVDPDIAIKDTPAPEIDLPGVMKIDGASRQALDPTMARQISMTNGGSQSVYMSATDPNRIQLPFSNPRVISTTEIEIDKRKDSNNIYVTIAPGVTHPVQVFIEPADSSAVLGLQIVPKRIPAQTLIVVDDGNVVGVGRPPAARSDQYVVRVQSLLESIALDSSPIGYAQTELKLPPIAVDGLVMENETRFSGRADDIYVYSLTNPLRTEVRLDERQFDGEDVLAVSIFPKPVLEPGQKAKVIVLAKKHQGS
jgi:conjugal transfer pilus assembly protein TraK